MERSRDGDNLEQPDYVLSDTHHGGENCHPYARSDQAVLDCIAASFVSNEGLNKRRNVLHLDRHCCCVVPRALPKWLELELNFNWFSI